MLEVKGTTSDIAKLKETTEALYNASRVGVMGATSALVACFIYQVIIRVFAFP
jgi:hypothetical protein